MIFLHEIFSCVCHPHPFWTLSQNNHLVMLLFIANCLCWCSRNRDSYAIYTPKTLILNPLIPLVLMSMWITCFYFFSGDNFYHQQTAFSSCSSHNPLPVFFYFILFFRHNGCQLVTVWNGTTWEVLWLFRPILQTTPNPYSSLDCSLCNHSYLFIRFS